MPTSDLYNDCTYIILKNQHSEDCHIGVPNLRKFYKKDFKNLYCEAALKTTKWLLTISDPELVTEDKKLIPSCRCHGPWTGRKRLRYRVLQSHAIPGSLGAQMQQSEEFFFHDNNYDNSFKTR